MRNNRIDRILGPEPPLTPSPGFAEAVMDAVRRERATPEPLPFPWRRVVPGLVVCLLAILTAAVATLSGLGGAVTSPGAVATGLQRLVSAQSTLWLAGSLLASWMIVRVSLNYSGFRD